jgi:hypothetical protein
MANFQFSVNTDSIIHLTEKLESMNKYSFPSAVRATLNDASFEMKTKNILESAERNMKVKAPNFFKANTGVEKARFNRNIEYMSSTVGFMNKRGIKANKAVTYGMEANEAGSTDDTGMMYKKATRTGRGLVKRSKYYDRMKKTKNRSNKKGNSYVQSAFESLANKSSIMVDTKIGKAIIQVKSITSSKGKLRIKSDLLMLDRTVKKAKANATHFNREAAQKTQKQMEQFYIKNANYHFQRVWK